MSILNQRQGFCLRLFQFNCVEEIADAKEANALSDEAQGFHLTKIPSCRQEFER